MTAIPATQSCAGTVPRALKGRIFRAAAAPAKHLALPFGMRRPRAGMGGRLYKVAAHFIRTGDLQLCGGLVYPGKDCPPCSDFKSIRVTGGIPNRFPEFETGVFPTLAERILLLFPS